MIDEVKALRVEVTTALRERNTEREFRGAAEAAFAEQLARTKAAESALAAANAKADEYRTNWVSEEARRIKAEESLAAANARTIEKAELANRHWLGWQATQEALAAARRECEGLRAVLVEIRDHGGANRGIWSQYQARHALAAPGSASGEEGK